MSDVLGLRECALHNVTFLCAFSVNFHDEMTLENAKACFQLNFPLKVISSYVNTVNEMKKLGVHCVIMKLLWITFRKLKMSHYCGLTHILLVNLKSTILTFEMNSPTRLT